MKGRKEGRRRKREKNREKQPNNIAAISTVREINNAFAAHFQTFYIISAKYNGESEWFIAEDKSAIGRRIPSGRSRVGNCSFFFLSDALFFLTKTLAKLPIHCDSTRSGSIYWQGNEKCRRDATGKSARSGFRPEVKITSTSSDARLILEIFYSSPRRTPRKASRCA